MTVSVSGVARGQKGIGFLIASSADRKYQRQQGFTLVELALVLVIVGLLTGGILKGREMIENARVTSTVAQVKSYESAVTAFYDIFNVLPGDMPNASDRIANCPAACNAPLLTGDNNFIGAQTWTTSVLWPNQVTSPLNALPAVAVGAETQLFWVHLYKMDLITGVTDAPLRSSGTLTWAESHPASRIGGGFVVGYNNGATPPGAATPSATAGMTGTVLVLQQSVTGGIQTTRGTQPLTPARAAQIDRRMDDGLPHSGLVRAYGLSASCYNTTADTRYAETTNSKDCGLVFRIRPPPT